MGALVVPIGGAIPVRPFATCSLLAPSSVAQPLSCGTDRGTEGHTERDPHGVLSHSEHHRANDYSERDTDTDWEWVIHSSRIGGGGCAHVP